MKYIIYPIFCLIFLFIAQTSLAQNEGIEIKLEYNVENCENNFSVFQPSNGIKGGGLTSYTDYFNAASNTASELTPIKNKVKIYTVDMYVRHTPTNEDKYLGHSSIYFTYDPDVLSFKKYTSVNFDENTYCTIPEDMPYKPQAFDGSKTGHFLMTMLLQQPTVIPSQIPACQTVNEWTLVGTVSFEVRRPSQSPNITLQGTPSGYPTDTKGCNFSDDTNQNKYEQFFINNVSRSFNQLCPSNTISIFSFGGGKTLETESNDSFNINVSPNPFQNEAFITYTNSQKEVITLTLYNEQGQQIKTLVNRQTFAEGNHSWHFDLQEVPNGIYYLLLQTDQKAHTTKLVKMDK